MRALLIGYYGGRNFGDEAILESIIRNFEHLDKDFEAVVATQSETHTQSMYDCDTVSKSIYRPKHFIHFLRKILTCHKVILGGGGLIHDRGGRYVLGGYIIPVLLGKLFGKPLIVLCIGADPPFKSGVNQSIVKHVMNMADHISVRDELTKDFLQKIGVTNEINVVGDPALCLSLQSLTGIPFSVITDVNEHVIGVNLREWSADTRKLSRELVSLLDVYLDNRSRIVFLCSPMDINFVRQIINAEKVRFDYEIVDCVSMRPSYILKLIQGFEFIFSMRLHFLIDAVITNVPCIGLPYLDKVKCFCNSFKIPMLSSAEISERDLQSLIDQNVSRLPYRSGVLDVIRKRIVDDFQVVLGAQKVRARHRFYSIVLLFVCMIFYGGHFMKKLRRTAGESK